MRIAFITQDDSFYIGRFFRTFLARCDDDQIEVLAGVVCRTMGKSKKKLARELYDFYGPVDFTRMGLRYTANKALAASVGSLTRRWPFTLSQIFNKYGIEVISTRNVNGNTLQDRLRQLDLDLIVSVAAPQILKARLLSLPRLGCINIHTARLPQYRGMMPNFWVLYHDDERSAITIHTMDTEIDRGQILFQREFEIRGGESLDELIKRTKVLGAETMLEALREIARNGFEPIAPPDVEPSYFSFPTKEHVKRFRKQGKRLL